MNIVFLYGKQPSATLTLLGTGSTCYHVGFTDRKHFWDMHLIRRRRLWPDGINGHPAIIAPCPVDVTADYLDYKLDTDESTYGVLDYCLFAARPIFHLFGKSTRNAGGVICSEMVWDDLVSCGWDQHYQEVPSPADLEVRILGVRNALHKGCVPLEVA